MAKDRTKSAKVYPVAALARLTLVQMLRTRSAFLLAAALVLPMVYIVYWSLSKNLHDDPAIIWGSFYVIVYLGIVVPIVALFYGAMLFGAEKEDRTLTFLVTRPAPRWLIVVVKYFTAAGVLGAGVFASMLASYWLLGIHIPFSKLMATFNYWLPLAAVALLGLFVYLAIFMLAGMLVRRSMVYGLVFIVLWEGIVSLIQRFICYLTMSYYLRSIGRHATGRISAIPRWAAGGDPAPMWVAILVPVAVLVFCLALAVAHFSREEFHTNPDR